MLYQVPERPTSPYVGSIAELLGRSAEIQAQRLRDVAAIQAQVESQKGQNRGNTIATIGQLGAQTIGGILDVRQKQKTQQALAAYLQSGNVTIGGLMAHGYKAQDAAAYVKATTPEAVKPVPVETMDAEGNPTTQFVIPQAGASYQKPRPKDEDTPVAKAMKITGLLEPGNIDLYDRPPVKNPDGTTSTVRSMSINEDGKEILIPTVVDGRVVSDDEAVDAYHRTGQHLGIFRDVPTANAYASRLHDEYAAGKYTPKTEKAEPVGTFDAYVRTYAKEHGKAVPDLTTKDIEDARKRYNQSDDRPLAGQAPADIPGNWDLSGEEFLASIPPRWRQTVKKIANYDEDITKVTSMRNNERSTVAAWVNQVNPDWDTSLFANRAPTRKAFTTGVQGQQINAMNTAIGHIDQLMGVGEALHNGTFKPGNALYNAVKETFGSSAPTNFDTLKDALAGEVSSVLAKGGATVSGIAEAKQKISTANSPEQLAGYVKTLIPIMGSKLGELNFQYHQAMGERDSFSALSPKSKEILTRLGFDPEHPDIRQQTGGGTIKVGGFTVVVKP